MISRFDTCVKIPTKHRIRGLKSLSTSYENGDAKHKISIRESKKKKKENFIWYNGVYESLKIRHKIDLSEIRNWSFRALWRFYCQESTNVVQRSTLLFLREYSLLLGNYLELFRQQIQGVVIEWNRNRVETTVKICVNRLGSCLSSRSLAECRFFYRFHCVIVISRSASCSASCLPFLFLLNGRGLPRNRKTAKVTGA